MCLCGGLERVESATPAQAQLRPRRPTGMSQMLDASVSRATSCWKQAVTQDPSRIVVLDGMGET